MKVYFITQKAKGEFVTLEPKIPVSSPDEEGKTPRICVSMSILGALCSIGQNLCLGCNTYIYAADIDINELYQPNKEVSDADMTGELWILKPETFYLHKVIHLYERNEIFEVMPNLKEQEDQRSVAIGGFRFRDVRRGIYDV